MARTAAASVKGLIALPLICGKVIAADLVKCARVRAPCAGRLWAAVPVYGVADGTTPHTDIKLKVWNDTQSDVQLFDETSNQHPIYASSDWTTDAPDLVDAARDVAEGDILCMDADISGGSSPTSTGFGYILLFEPTK